MKAGKVGARMRCRRCHGLMVVDYFTDMGDDEGHLWLRAWRCVNCREVAEPGIARHRFAQRSRLAHLVKRFTGKSRRAREIVRLSA